MAEFDFASITAQAGPIAIIIGEVLLGLICLGGVWWFLFVYLRAKKWKVRIWEMRSDGKLHFIRVDTLVEKFYNKRKQVLYRLKGCRAETVPPPADCIYRIKRGDWCDYERINEDYIPLSRDTKQEISEHYIQQLRRNIWNVRKLGPEEVMDKYIYAPIYHTVVRTIPFVPIEYDVNMMRINAIDNRDKVYADKLSFLQQYGPWLALGGVIVLMIVAIYFNFDFAKWNIEKMWSKGDQFLSAAEMLLQKTGGVAPPV